jgi:hypothetical protein
MPKMTFNHFPVGAFNICESTAQPGESYTIEFPVETVIDDMPAINVITAGSFSYGPFPNGSFTTMSPGFSSHSNLTRPAGQRTITALEADSGYLCISPLDKNLDFSTRRLDLTIGETALIRQGAVFIAAKGSFSINGTVRAAPLILHAETAAFNVEALTDFAGIEAWLL